jgi:hypothetical protein
VAAALRMVKLVKFGRTAMSACKASASTPRTSMAWPSALNRLLTCFDPWRTRTAPVRTT